MRSLTEGDPQGFQLNLQSKPQLPADNGNFAHQ
jgi:hypothetical protein